MVQNTETSVTKWGDIGEWDVSGVKTFHYAFSQDRKEDCCFGALNPANTKATSFAGFAGIKKWDTSSVTSMNAVFRKATMMDADLTKWDVRDEDEESESEREREREREIVCDRTR